MATDNILLDGTLLTVRNASVAASMTRPRSPNTNPDVAPCEVCGKKLEEVFITTGGAAGDAAVYAKHPVAVDGWCCAPCGVFRYPRDISPERITQIMEEGVEHGRAGRYIEAELCFLRVVWDWPGYPPGHLNYAEATRSRLHHTRDSLDDAGRQRLVDRMIEQYEEGITDAQQASPSVARAFLTVVEHALQTRALDRARRFLTRMSSLVSIDDETHQRAAEMLAFIEQRIDLFQSAAEALGPFIDLQGRASKPIEAADRATIAKAIEQLEEHLRYAPDRWQSAWFYAKALFAAERVDDGIAAFERASKKFPDSIEIARDFSNHLLKSERVEQAREVNRAIVALHPDNAAMHCNLAVTELLCGDVDGANRALATARSLDPDDPIAKAVEARVARGAPFPSTLRELERGK